MSATVPRILSSRALSNRPANAPRTQPRNPRSRPPGVARATLSGSPARRRDARVPSLPNLLVPQEARAVVAPREAPERAGDSPMLYPRISLSPVDSAPLPAPAPHQDDAKKAADELMALAAKAAAMASALEEFDLPSAKVSARASQPAPRTSAAARRGGDAGANRTVASRSSRAAASSGAASAAQRTLDAARRRSRVVAEAVAQERDRTREGSVSSSEGGASVTAEIGGAPLLTAAQEVELSRQIQDSLELERIQAGLAEQLGRPPTMEEWAGAVGVPVPAFAERIRRGHQAKDHMVQANLRLVVSVAKKYIGRGVSFQDLVQEGTMGLVRGAEKFDYERGYKFSTYAHWWIRQAITRAIADHSRTIRLPVHMFEYLSRYNKAKKRLQDDLGRLPTEAELAEDLGLSVEKVVLLSKCSATPTSLDALVGDDSRRETRLEDMIEDESAGSGEQTVGETLLREDLANVLNTLNVREREVLKMRFGLDDGTVKTLDEVGSVFRLTRERIRQIEVKALRKLRQPQRNFALREHMEDRLDAAANADINWIGMQTGAAHRRG